MTLSKNNMLTFENYEPSKYKKQILLYFEKENQYLLTTSDLHKSSGKYALKVGEDIVNAYPTHWVYLGEPK